MGAVLVACGLAPACSTDGPADSGVGPADSGSGPGSSTSSSASTTNGSTGSTSTGSVDPDGTTDVGPIDLGPCGRVADCIEARDEPITGFLGVYGANGTCWGQFSQEQCWQDCRGLFAGYGSACPEEPACCECTAEQDCLYTPMFDACFENECVSAGEIDGCEVFLNSMCAFGGGIGASLLAQTCFAGSPCLAEADAFTSCVLFQGGRSCEPFECLLELACDVVEGCEPEGAALQRCEF